MKKIHRLLTLAALALLAASCTDQYDPAGVSPEAMAGAPINISVAPPPAFTEVNATSHGTTAAPNDLQPATRASQTDKATQWEAGDILWLAAEFYEDKETADVSAPGNSAQISALKYTGTTWRMLSPKEAEEIGANVLPDFVRQLHWPKEIGGWKAPVMWLRAQYLGDRKPNADGSIIITPKGKAPTTPTLYSEPAWITPGEASTKLELRNGDTRLLIPAGYSVKGATYTYKTYINARGGMYPDRDPISAQPEDTYMFVYETSTIELEKDGKEIAFTLPPITDEEGKPTREGASYILTPYDSGAETPLSPGTYDLLISNEKELRAFADSVNKDKTINGLNGPVPASEATVLQTANITLSSEEWTPIGGQSPFRGRYNGNGHTIENMTITKGIQKEFENKYIYAGMFRSIFNAVLTGINLRNVKIEINADNTIYQVRTGSLAGEITSSTISLCSATGQVIVRGDAEMVRAGGIAGISTSMQPPSSTISRCRAIVKVEAITQNATGNGYAGGIVGENNIGSSILSCEAQGKTIIAEGGKFSYAGGIAGRSSGASIIAFCHAGNKVNAQNGDVNYAGGLVGVNVGYLYASYATGNATTTSTGGSNYAGSLVGDNNVADWVQHCYGAGTASPDNSNLAADANNIVYKQNPAAGEILTLMQMHTDALEFLPGNPDFCPTTTHYDPSASPAYGIEPIRVKWSNRAWKQGSDPKYPEIDREYQGE